MNNVNETISYMESNNFLSEFLNKIWKLAFTAFPLNLKAIFLL